MFGFYSDRIVVLQTSLDGNARIREEETEHDQKVSEHVLFLFLCLQLLFVVDYSPLKLEGWKFKDMYEMQERGFLYADCLCCRIILQSLFYLM